LRRGSFFGTSHPADLLRCAIHREPLPRNGKAPIVSTLWTLSRRRVTVRAASHRVTFYRSKRISW
jgi:hypothetical protein